MEYWTMMAERGERPVAITEMANRTNLSILIDDDHFLSSCKVTALRNYCSKERLLHLII
ncbi:MAG: hypothetical protein IPP49_21085 [Saprospiraceae bacterium]|nr:hypothetical protein [Saprospiraceae bacterium]